MSDFVSSGWVFTRDKDANSVFGFLDCQLLLKVTKVLDVALTFLSFGALSHQGKTLDAFVDKYSFRTTQDFLMPLNQQQGWKKGNRLSGSRPCPDVDCPLLEPLELLICAFRKLPTIQQKLEGKRPQHPQLH